jgi:hypothetical protein
MRFMPGFFNFKSRRYLDAAVKETLNKSPLPLGTPRYPRSVGRSWCSLCRMGRAPAKPIEQASGCEQVLRRSVLRIRSGLIPHRGYRRWVSLALSAIAPALPYLLHPCSRRQSLLHCPISCILAVVGNRSCIALPPASLQSYPFYESKTKGTDSYVGRGC